MSLNQFLFDHQLAAMKVGRSGSVEEREEAVDLTGRLAKRIVDWRYANGLPVAGWPRDERPLLAGRDGLVVVPVAADPDQSALGAWESEGGGLLPDPPRPLPRAHAIPGEIRP